jgi:arylformamidase
VPEGPSRLISLSHPLDPDGPAWPGSPELRVEPVKSLAAGGTSNTALVHLYSHTGTHVDVPRHVFPGGQALTDLPLDAFVFDRPAIVDLALGENALVGAADLRDRAEQLEGSDLLIFRSGFESARSDKDAYGRRGPGFSAQAARWLRENLPAVRGVAVDFVSLSAYQKVDEGRAAHRILLAVEPSGRPVLIFEDVRVSALGDALPRRVIALPLMIGGLDGFPCTILAET